MNKRPVITLGDGIVILFLLLLAGGVSAWTLQRSAGASAVVTVDGNKVAVLPLGEKASITVRGPIGDTVVMSDEKGVHIESSPCPNKICIHMGSVHQTGQTLLCVPNHVAVRIQGEAGGDGVDGVTG